MSSCVRAIPEKAEVFRLIKKVYILWKVTVHYPVYISPTFVPIPSQTI